MQRVSGRGAGFALGALVLVCAGIGLGFYYHANREFVVTGEVFDSNLAGRQMEIGAPLIAYKLTDSFDRRHFLDNMLANGAWVKSDHRLISAGCERMWVALDYTLDHQASFAAHTWTDSRGQFEMKLKRGAYCIEVYPGKDGRLYFDFITVTEDTREILSFPACPLGH